MVQVSWTTTVIVSSHNPLYSACLDWYACSAGGWRVGYAIMPKGMDVLKTALVSAASHTYSCAPAPMQAALEKGLRNNKKEIEEYLRQERTILNAVGDYIVRYARLQKA